jgi:hypothetical protein
MDRAFAADPTCAAEAGGAAATASPPTRAIENRGPTR